MWLACSSQCPRLLNKSSLYKNMPAHSIKVYLFTNSFALNFMQLWLRQLITVFKDFKVRYFYSLYRAMTSLSLKKNDSLHVSSIHKHLNQNRNMPNLMTQIKLSTGLLRSRLLFQQPKGHCFMKCFFRFFMTNVYDANATYGRFSTNIYTNHCNVVNRKIPGDNTFQRFLSEKF